MYAALARYYDLIYEGKDYRTESRSILRLARRELGRAPRTLLDVACGTGRHLAEFRRHLSVEGVDASREMLRIARQRLGRDVPLHRGDMRDFRLGRRFDAISCLFSAIAYLATRRDRELALANFYRHLRPGGVALVEGWVLPSRWKDHSVHLQAHKDPDTVVACVSSSRREGNDSVIEFQYLIAERGKRIRHLTELDRFPLVEPEEMLRSFRRIGFRAKAVRSGTYRDRALYIGVRPPEGA